MAEGQVEKFPAGQVFYALDFKEELYIVKHGYVKRYSVTAENNKVIESIYGPGYFFPLTPIFSKLWNFNLSQENNTYVYQAMTDLELEGISFAKLEGALKKDPGLYAGLLYESGRRLKANINRLASNALKNDYLKITHQLVYLAEEFGDVQAKGVKQSVKLTLPLTAEDMAEQLNISVEIAEAVMDKLVKQGLVEQSQNGIFIPDINMLKEPVPAD